MQGVWKRRMQKQYRPAQAVAKEKGAGYFHVAA